MKKLILVIAVALIGFTSNAQSISAGLSGGLPIGDAGDFFTFGLVLDAGVHWEVSDDFNVGAALGYINAFGDTFDAGPVSVEVEDSGFIPIAASGRYMISEQFSLGADVGYALAVAPDNADGGFYYAPKAVYYLGDNFGIVASYRAVTQDVSDFNIVSLGFEYKFN